MPTRDGSASACLVIINLGAGCGGPQLLATTGIGVTRVEQSGDASPWAPGGHAYFYGIVPSTVVSVAALDRRHRVIKQVKVVGQAYQLDVATDHLASVEYRDALGNATAATPLGSASRPTATPTPA